MKEFKATEAVACNVLIESGMKSYKSGAEKTLIQAPQNSMPATQHPAAALLSANRVSDTQKGDYSIAHDRMAHDSIGHEEKAEKVSLKT